MNKTSKTILFFGNERIATGVTTTAPILQGLIDAGYTVAAVVSHNEATKSRNSRELEVAQIAAKHDIPVLLPDRPKEILDQLQSYGAEAAILVAYGRIIPQTVIDIFPRGIINLHPSLLPKHRGPTPLESVILDGSEETGVSIMQLAKEMDAGPIYAQSEYTITPNVTKQKLADDLLEIGSAMLLEVLPGILDGSVVALPQAENAATYDGLLTKEDATLDFTKPAEVLEREIRAFAEWPKSKTTLGGIDVIITKARAADVPTQKKPGEFEVLDDSNTLVLYCGNGYLCVDRLKPAGKAEMAVEGFLAGYGTRLRTG